MTTELHLVKRCDHGKTKPHHSGGFVDCRGGSVEVLDPERVMEVVALGTNAWTGEQVEAFTADVKVKHILDALTEGEN